MTTSPVLGILFHWIGGLAAASFYIPYKQVRRWSWETYWLVGGVFSWLIMPVLMASLLTPDLGAVLRSVDDDLSAGDRTGFGEEGRKILVGH